METTNTNTPGAVIGLLIEDDERGLNRAIDAARAQDLRAELECYARKDVTWAWVKSYKEFMEYIERNGLPDILAFDHDLSDDAYELWHKNRGYKNSDINYDEYVVHTGYHCAKWLTEYCQDNEILLTCEVYAHSMNVKGRENINAILNNFKRFQDTYGRD